MQKNHIEQGHFEDVLGMYYLSSNQKMTADNTEVFNSSSYQIISKEKIFSLAKQLATSLNQESIAVFIPGKKQVMGEVKLSFTNELSINDALKLIKEKLPSIYLQAFSLHLSNECNQFDRAKVSSIEWLGSKLKLDEVKKAFPHEKVTSQSGSIFLVYQNGKKEKL